MTPGVPDRIDRAAFDRVLQRAAELQASSKDIGEGLSEEEVLALGQEVGIPGHHLKQALLEERTHVAVHESHSALDRLVAPADFFAERVVQGTPDLIVSAMTRWLEAEEHFVVQRSLPDRATYEPMSGFARGMRLMARAFRGPGANSYLGKADTVSVTATALEPGYCHVVLTASGRRTRAGYVSGGAALAGVGVVGGALLSVLSVGLAVIPVVVMTGSGWLVSRLYRQQAERIQLGLERALDELERNPVLALPASAQRTGQLARGVGSVVREIRDEVRRALEQ
jgi:hypothetical protein